LSGLWRAGAPWCQRHQYLLEGGAWSLQQDPGGHGQVSPPHRGSTPDTGHKSLAHAGTSRLQLGECQSDHAYPLWAGWHLGQPLLRGGCRL